MTHVWPTVSLGEVIALSQDEHRVLATSSYPNIGIYSFGRGVFEKPPIEGATTSARTLFRVRARQFIYSRLFAFEGAYGLVPEAYDGCFVSNEFPSFDINQERLCPEFLALHFKLPSTWNALATRTVGMGDRRQRIKPDQLLSYEFPLPSLAKQGRIVAKIERLAAKIAQATGLRQSLVTEADALFLSGLDDLLRGLSARLPSRSLLSLCDPARGISYGIVQTGNPVDGGIPTLRAGDLARFNVITANVKRVDAQIEAKYGRTRLRGNELLLRIRGGLGEVAVCPGEMVGGNVSREIAVIPLLPGTMTEYAMYAVAAPLSQDFLQRHLRGTSYVGINLKDVRRLDLPVPQYEEQRRIVAYLDSLRAKVDRLKALQAQTRAELDALLPSILDQAFKGEIVRRRI